MVCFQGCSIKALVDFPWTWVMVFDLGISKGCQCHTVSEIPGVKAIFCRISKDKVTNLKIPGGFQKAISSVPPPCLDFFGKSPSVTLRTPIKINQVRTQAVAEALVCHWDPKGLHIVKNVACGMTGLLGVGNLDWGKTWIHGDIIYEYNISMKIH